MKAIKGPTNNCRIECVIASKRGSLRCELHIGDIKTSNLHSIVIDSGKCNTEIEEWIELEEDSFQKRIRVLRDLKI